MANGNKFSNRAVAVLPISFTAGNDIGECCKEALRIANLLDVSVEWTMNGVSMFATRFMAVAVLEATYYKNLPEAVRRSNEASFARTADSLGNIPDGEKSANDK